MSSKKSPLFKIVFAAIICAMAFLIGCKPTPDTPSSTEQDTLNTDVDMTPVPIVLDTEKANMAASWIFEKKISALDKLIEHTQSLDKAISSLLSNPDEKTLKTAQEQWQTVFFEYQILTPLLFFNAPELNEALTQWRFKLAAWPLQPGYLDSYDVYLHSGIVNDISLLISEEPLRTQHGLTDTEEVTLGLYALEFLLWGDKEEAKPERFKAQNSVPTALAQSELKVSELPNNRRRQLLDIQSELFQNDFQELLTQWQPDGSLYSTYEKLSPSDKVMGYHKGCISALNHLETLLAYNIERSEPVEGQQPNVYPQRFELRRTDAAIEQIAAIEALYEMSAQPTLASALDENSLEEMQGKLNAVKAQLAQ